MTNNLARGERASYGTEPLPYYPCHDGEELQEGDQLPVYTFDLTIPVDIAVFRAGALGLRFIAGEANPVASKLQPRLARAGAYTPHGVPETAVLPNSCEFCVTEPM